MAYPSEPGPREAAAETIGVMLHAYAAQSLGAQSARAKVATYLMALEDLPAWAIQEAYRRWTLGEAGSDVPASEYSFAPSTVRLRRLAQFCIDVVEGQRRRFERILEAEAEPVLSDAQLQATSAQLGEVSQSITKAASMTPARPGGRTPAEQDAETRENSAHWQRWLAERATPEATNDAA